MRSSSRNSRRPHRALALAAAVSLLLGSAAQAADEPHNFVLTAFSNGRGGSELTHGNYEAAVRELGTSPNAMGLDPASLSNNRCVAYSITRQWESARIACDTAVRIAQQERASLPTYMIWAHKLQNDYVAMALSNRAVLHWMSADAEAAESDLKKAENLAPHASFVAHNLNSLHASHNTVAQVTVTPQT